MRPLSTIVAVSYLLAAGAAVAALLAGNQQVARASVVVAFAALMSAMWLGPDGPGRMLAVWALAATTLTAGSSAPRPADLVAETALGTGAVLWTAAMLRSGGWARLRRNKWIVALYAVVAAVPAMAAFIGLGTELPQALAPMPAGCVDTCWGPAVGAILAAIVLAEILLLTMAAAAFARGLATGLGAFMVVIALNALFFLAPPSPSVGYAASLAAWFAGLPILAWPWIGRSRAGQLSNASGGGQEQTRFRSP
jgi:hypothetical protein